MSSSIIVRPDSPILVQFTRSATGHVQSCWWSYPWKDYNPDGPYAIGSHFHALRAQSISAFASALGIREDRVIVSERKSPIDDQLEWRCGTAGPVELPKIQLPKLKPHRDETAAIDIETLQQPSTTQ